MDPNAATHAAFRRSCGCLPPPVLFLHLHKGWLLDVDSIYQIFYADYNEHLMDPFYLGLRRSASLLQFNNSNVWLHAVR